MATKFQQIIASNNAYSKRSKSIEQKAKIAQESIVNSLKNKKANLELKVEDLLDFAPESKDSLRPGSADWDAQTWAIELQNIKTDLANTQLQLEIAENTLNDYFVDLETK